MDISWNQIGVLIYGYIQRNLTYPSSLAMEKYSLHHMLRVQYFLTYFDQVNPNYGTFLFWAIFNHIAALIPGSHLHFILKMPTYVIHMGLLQWNQLS